MGFDDAVKFLTGRLRESTLEETINGFTSLVRLVKNDGIQSGTDQKVLSMFHDVAQSLAADLDSYSGYAQAARAKLQAEHEARIKGAEKVKSDSYSKATDDLAQTKSRNDKAEQELVQANQQMQQSKQENERKFESLGFFDRMRFQEEHDLVIRSFDRKIAENNKAMQDIAAARPVAENYCKEQKQKADRAFASEKAEIDQLYDDAKKRADAALKEASAAARKRASNFLSNAISVDAFGKYEDFCKSYRPNYAHFSMLEHGSIVAPAHLHILLGMAMTSLDSAPNGFGGNFAGIDSPIVETRGNMRFASLPFIDDLSDGLRIIIEPESSATDWINKANRILTLRLLMAYPPAKLQLTMIDPLKNGLSFSGIPDIADKQHESIISGGVITESEYITDMMSSLHKKMADYARSYGTDRDAYFSREAVQAVIINDFPGGFSKEAMSYLARTIENGENFGMVFFIGLNPTFAGAFDNDPNYSLIMNRLSFMHVSGDGDVMKIANSPFSFYFADEEEVEKNADEIIKAIRDGVTRSQGRKESFDQLFEGALYDENAWHRESSTEGFSIPLGVSGASNIQRIIGGMPGASTIHHGLISGPTGAGKSTTLHTMIMSTILKYPPEEMQLVLIDFKEGTEFREYAKYKIPHIRSITTTTEPEFALAALSSLEAEYEKRASEIGDLREHILESRRAGIEPLFQAKILLIFDEVQALFTDGVPEDIKQECLRILTKFVTKGRAMGIHVFLASQNFERIPCIKPLMSDMRIRLCLKGADTGGILENADELRDSPAGSAILNNEGGRASDNESFRICMLEDDEQIKLLELLTDKFESSEYEDLHGKSETQLLFTNIEDNYYHPLNRFIDERLFGPSDEVDPLLYLGSKLKAENTSSPYKETGSPCVLWLKQENLLLLGNNTTTAQELFMSLMVSACLDGLRKGVQKTDKIILFDFTEGVSSMAPSDGESTALSDACFGDIVSSLGGKIKSVPTVVQKARKRGRREQGGQSSSKSPLEAQIDEIFDELDRRIKAFEDPTVNDEDVELPRIFLLLYGVGNALSLANADTQEGGAFGEMSALRKLQTILQDGCVNEIYSIVWAQNKDALENILNFNHAGTSALSYFDNRVVFSASKEEFQTVAACSSLPATRADASFCCLSSNERLTFRPFDTFTAGWVQDFCDAYEDLNERDI